MVPFGEALHIRNAKFQNFFLYLNALVFLLYDPGEAVGQTVVDELCGEASFGADRHQTGQNGHDVDKVSQPAPSQILINTSRTLSILNKKKLPSEDAVSDEGIVAGPDGHGQSLSMCKHSQEHTNQGVHDPAMDTCVVVT